MTLDDIDKQIIGNLLEDSRKKFSDIGKEIGISKNAVWTRYQNMVKEGIITGATLQINYKKLGYDAVATLLLDVDPPQIEQVSNFIKKRIPDVFGPFPSASKYNLRAVVALKTISELANIKEELRKKLVVNEISSSIWTDVWLTPENFTLIPVHPPQSENESAVDETIFAPDSLDLYIIQELTHDSRISFRDLAKKLGCSTNTISKRYEKLVRNNIIQARIQMDLSKIGYYAMTHFYLRVSPQYEIDQAVKEIIKMPDICYTMKCKGDYNMATMLMTKSIQDVIKTGEHLSIIPGLKRTETTTNELAKGWPIPRTYTSTMNRTILRVS